VIGHVRYDRLLLKRGVVDTTLFEWFRETVRTGPKTKDVKVTLLDEARNPVVSWLFRRAWPSKYTGPAMNGKGNDPAIESLELEFEPRDMQ